MNLGKAFSDNVFVEKHKVSRDINQESQSWWLGMGRVLMFATVFCIAFFILLWRLFDLTIIQGRSFRLLSDGNRTRELIRHAPRGIFVDRTGKPLVENIAYYRLIKPCAEGQSDCTTPITKEEGEQLEKKGLPAGSFLEIDYRRNYLYPEALAHVLGYTGEVTQRELEDEYYKLRRYLPGDRVGRTGAEAVFEDLLRGTDGRELVEVDATGAIIRTLGRDKESPGEDVTLSLDAGLQKVAAESFPVGRKGAVIVSKPTTGEILALYSSPTYNMNAFSLGLSQQEYESVMTNPDQPMFDRAIGGVYPPGSTYKLVTSLAALEEEAVTPDTLIEDTGVLKIGPFSFPNWYFLQYGKTDGMVNVVKALQRSNDIYFYKAGEAVGITKLVEWSKKVGLSKPLGIELGGEASGLMPDPAWKKTRFSTPEDRQARNDEWYVGDTYHISIGQGYLLVTPLQVNAWTNVVANEGVLCTPTIKKVDGRRGRNESRCKDLGVQKETIATITKGLLQACEDGGTGWPLFGFGVSKSATQEEVSVSSKIRIPVACKTGTAEFGDPKNNTHAWFTAYAPVPDQFVDISSTEEKVTGTPELSVTVLVEEAGEGSNVAAPVAKKIFEEWFGR
jgi:penicillin-binding protein 2